MWLKDFLKRTILYRYVVGPLRINAGLKINMHKQQVFKQEGLNALRQLVAIFDAEDIRYWLEFGTLLGAYRDGAFVPNEMDLDVGVHLSDARRIYHLLTKNGFSLCREFHVVGENGLEQTYEYHGATIDIMFFYETEGFMYCDGAIIPANYKKLNVFEHGTTSHKFTIFECTKMSFLGIDVSIPANTEEHLIEIFGEGFRVYDPDFKVDYNKTFYSKENRPGIGFAKY